jgi:hypothetical protein
MCYLQLTSLQLQLGVVTITFLNVFLATTKCVWASSRHILMKQLAMVWEGYGVLTSKQTNTNPNI